MELTIEQYAGNLYIPPTVGITATDAFEQALNCIEQAIFAHDNGYSEARVHVATAWLWLDAAAERLGDPPPNLRESCGLSRLDYTRGCLMNFRHYALLWEFGYTKNPDYLASAWAALRDARESLRGWWEQQP